MMSFWPTWLSGPTTLVFAGALLSAFGALAATQRAARKSLEAAEALTSMHKELAAKSEEIARLNAELLRSVMGDSYPSLWILTPSSGQTSLSLNNQGNYPIYDIELVVKDATQFGNLMRERKNEIRNIWDFQKLEMECTTVKQIGTLPPHSSQEFMQLTMPGDGADWIFLISTTARNGGVTHRVAFRRLSGVWAEAHRSMAGDKILEDAVYPGFEGLFPPIPSPSASAK